MADRRFVLDTSIALTWLLKDQQTSYGDAVFSAIANGSMAAVPTLFYMEVANTILVAERRKLLAIGEADVFLNNLQRTAFEMISIQTDEIWSEALVLGRTHQLSAYDACYLHVAVSQSLPIATQDKALLRAAQRIGVALFDPFH